MPEAKEDQIEREFRAGDMSYIDAVLAIQALGYLPEDAEDIVEEWEAANNRVVRNND